MLLYYFYWLFVHINVVRYVVFLGPLVKTLGKTSDLILLARFKSRNLKFLFIQSDFSFCDFFPHGIIIVFSELLLNCPALSRWEITWYRTGQLQGLFCGMVGTLEGNSYVNGRMLFCKRISILRTPYRVTACKKIHWLLVHANYMAP